MDKSCIKSKRAKKLIKTASVLCASGLIAASLSGCYFMPSEEAVIAPPLIETPKVTYETVEAKIGSIDKRISASGTLQSSYQENLYFKNKGGVLKAVNVKLGDKVNKGQLVAELDTDSLQSQIKQQEISVRQAQISDEKVKANPAATSYDIESADLNVKSANLKLADLKNDLEKARLYSTITGYVVYIDTVNPGDNVSANKTLVTVADPNQLYVIYKGDNSSDFQQGIKLDVKYKGQVYPGEVVAGPNNRPADASKTTQTLVYIKVSNLPKEAAIGDSVDLTYILEKKDNVIVIPRNLVSNFSGRNYVQVLENDVKYERDVELGLQNATEVEIVKGIKEGDKIIQR